MLKKDLLKPLNRRIDRDKREMNGYVLNFTLLKILGPLLDTGRF